MNSTVPIISKYLGLLVEYLDNGKLRPALVVREAANQLGVVEPGGRERTIARDLVLIAHPDRKATRDNLAEVAVRLEDERLRLKSELDLNLLWEVVHEQGRSFRADELAELFFGERTSAGTAVMIDALFNDRLYFVRRHLEFMPRSAEQVERLHVQYDKVRLRSETSFKTRNLVYSILNNGLKPAASDAEKLVSELTNYLENPFTRNRDLTTILEDVAAELTPAEVAYEVLNRLGAPPSGPRFVILGGLRTNFSEAALEEARRLEASPRPLSDDEGAVTIDDEDTVEIDDAISCVPLADGNLRIRVHIALVADLVPKSSAMDREAAARGATVYLPEATVRMLPDGISCDRASLLAGPERNVLTTDITLSPMGEMLNYSVYPSRVRVAMRLTYDEADQLLAGESNEQDHNRVATTLQRLDGAAFQLRERRRAAGALLIQRREQKIKVCGDEIELKVIDNSSPSRQMIAEFMVLSNYAAARLAAERGIPLIYRVQPSAGGDVLTQRPRLSLYPEYHSGVGVDFYAQLSSPIRRYMDLVLQRQLLAALSEQGRSAYEPEELFAVLAGAESAEAEGKELERRAKRYWALRYLMSHAIDSALEATVLRDGASAELDAYAVRGTLRGAPNLASQSRIIVRIGRIDPLRGWLTLDYVSTPPAFVEGVR